MCSETHWSKYAQAVNALSLSCSRARRTPLSIAGPWLGHISL